MKLTKSALRDILETRFAIGRDDDGDYYTDLSADKDFGHAVRVSFILEEESQTLTAMAYSALDVDSSLEDEVVAFCNEWNVHHRFGTAYAHDGDPRIKYCLNDPGEVSKEYLLNSFVLPMISFFWGFFKDVGAKFDA